MALKIDRKLNLVLPVDRTAGGTIYVYSIPISAETFEAYASVIALAWSRLTGGGYTLASGMRIAKIILKKAAVEQGVWEGPDGVENGLIVEMHRLTSVLAPVDRGWSTLQLDDAIKMGVIEAEDVEEVQNVLVFFTLAYSMVRKTHRQAMLESALNVWDARVVSSSITEFVGGLPTSTPAASTGEKAPASSIPS